MHENNIIETSLAEAPELPAFRMPRYEPGHFTKRIRSIIASGGGFLFVEADDEKVIGNVRTRAYHEIRKHRIKVATRTMVWQGKAGIGVWFTPNSETRA